MIKILVVDDEPDLELLIKQRFRKHIREQVYNFSFAANGVEALQKLNENPEIDIVLTDINMPEMDGLTLLTKINEKNPLLKSVIVSAYGDMDNIRSAMNKGAFDFICKPINFQDLELTLEKTVKNVSQIKKTLQAVKENNILKMYVDPSVLSFMDRKEFESSLMTNETIEASVVFIDICNFTAISETETADKVVGLLNRYFDVIVKEILSQDGYIDKFMGDAVMAIFRGDYHLDRAIEASLALQKKIESLPVSDELLSFKPHLSIGINCGEMISGNIGSAELKRLDYTVIGDAVNISQRLQSAAGEGEILINENSYKKVKESFLCEKVGEVKLKNKIEPMTVYRVIS
jgi:class 3 adenylate cyclase/FixJ family two-component response regulator